GAEAGISAVTIVVSIVLGMRCGGQGFNRLRCCLAKSRRRARNPAFHGRSRRPIVPVGPPPGAGLKSAAVFASLREPAVTTSRPVSIQQEDLIQSVADALQ